MKIGFATDHGGFVLKEPILEALRDSGHKVQDFGAYNLNPEDDYPDYVRLVGSAIQRGEVERGVIVCGSGVGVSIAACKMRGIRAAMCHDNYSAHQGVEHDDMNVLCLGARVIGPELAKELVRAFAAAHFIGEGKYQRRVDKVIAIERDAR